MEIVGRRMKLDYEQSATSYIGLEIDELVGEEDELIRWQTIKLAVCFRQGNCESKRYSSHSL